MNPTPPAAPCLCHCGARRERGRPVRALLHAGQVGARGPVNLRSASDISAGDNPKGGVRRGSIDTSVSRAGASSWLIDRNRDAWSRPARAVDFNASNRPSALPFGEPHGRGWFVYLDSDRRRVVRDCIGLLDARRRSADTGGVAC
jgi:hypothetical protein